MLLQRGAQRPQDYVDASDVAAIARIAACSGRLRVREKKTPHARPSMAARPKGPDFEFPFAVDGNGRLSVSPVNNRHGDQQHRARYREREFAGEESPGGDGETAEEFVSAFFFFGGEHGRAARDGVEGRENQGEAEGPGRRGVREAGEGDE